MTLDNLERQNRGFYGFFSRYWAAQVFIIHKEAPPSPTPHAPYAEVYYGPDGPTHESKWYAIFETITTELEML